MDSRGNLWYECGISDETQVTLNVVRKNWAVANQDAIVSAKHMIFACTVHQQGIEIPLHAVMVTWKAVEC